jgi:hypothetical protein
MKFTRTWCIAVLLLWALGRVIATPAYGQAESGSSGFSRLDDFSYLGSFVSSTNQWASGTGWDLSFRKTWAPNFATSLDYLNDAHFPGHHRDGVTGEVWLPISFFSKHVTTISVGGGPFYYLDTAQAANPSGYADNHGWAWLSSVDARVLLLTPGDGTGLFFDLRFDHTAPAKSIETNSWAAGFGYRGVSDFDGTSGFRDSDGAPDWEITAYAYKTVVNSFSSQTSPAEEVEARWHIWNVFKVSGGWINEGNAQLIRRNGLESEIWAEPSFNSDLWSIGAGIGLYSAIDKYMPGPGRHASGIISAALSFRPLHFWGVEALDIRFLWHRIVTDYNRDTDIVLWGMGYRF